MRSENESCYVNVNERKCKMNRYTTVTSNLLGRFM